MELIMEDERVLQEKMEKDVPQTIKQMGGLDQEIRIYMEDYVYTYLYQYGQSKGQTEKVAALVGRYMEMEGEVVCIISGAIQGKGVVQRGGIEDFSDETWQHIYDQMDLYFPRTELLGWAHIQNGFGSFLMDKDEVFHLDCFKERWNIFYAMDVVERVDTFYVQGETAKILRPAKGYFIYYDKNEAMQEYMLDNPVNKPKMGLEDWEEEQTEFAFAPRELEDDVATEERMDAAKKIRAVLQQRETTVKKEKRNRYATLAACSCVLSAISLGVVLSLVNYMGRVQDLEGEISIVQSAYLAMESQVEQTLAEAQSQTQAVFSAETEPLSEMLADAVSGSKNMEKEAVGVWHMIATGENLIRLSEQYYGNDQWVDSIMEANGLDDADKIYAGQEIWIP